MWLFLSFDAVPQCFSFQAVQDAGLELLEPEVADVQVVVVIPGIPGIAEAYYLDKKEVGLLFDEYFIFTFQDIFSSI